MCRRFLAADDDEAQLSAAVRAAFLTDGQTTIIVSAPPAHARSTRALCIISGVCARSARERASARDFCVR